MTPFSLADTLLKSSTDAELYDIIDKARKILAERRDQKIAEETAILKPKIKAAYEAVAAIQAEYDAATLSIQKRVIKECRLDPAIQVHDDLAAELSNLEWKYPPTSGGPIG
jgi:hypothetical protein